MSSSSYETFPLISSSDISILRQHSDLTLNYLGACVIDVFEERFVDTLCRKTVRRSTKGVAALVGAAAKVAFIPIALQLPAGPVFATLNSIGFFKLEIWAGFAAIDQEAAPVLPLENRLNRSSRCTTCLKATFLPLAECLALISQLPSGFAAYQYNPQSFKLVAAAVTTVSLSLFPARSLQLTFNRLFKEKARTNTGVLLQKIKNECAQNLGANHANFLASSLGEKLAMVERIVNITQAATAQEKAQQYTQLFFQRPQSVPIKRKWPEWIGIGVGVVLTGVFEYCITRYTFTQTQTYISNNVWIAGGFAAVTCLSNLYLSGHSFINTSERLTTAIVNTLTRRPAPSIARQISPSLNLASQFLGLIVDGLALGPTVVIWGDYFKESPEEQYTFQIGMCAAIFILLFTATLDIVEDVVQAQIARCTTPQKADVIKLHNQFNKLASLLEKTSLLNFALFLNGMSADMKDTLLERFQLPQQDLSTFIREEAMGERSVARQSELLV